MTKKELEKISKKVEGCLELYKLSNTKLLLGYVEHHLNNIQFKKLNYKELDKGFLFDDLAQETEDLLFDNATTYDIATILENNYDNAVIGTLAGYNPKTKRIYVVTDDYYFTAKLKELSLDELRYLAIQIAKHIQEEK